MNKLIAALKAWFVARLFAWLATKEKFDIKKIVDGVESVYLRRWYIFKSNHFNVMLHNIKRSDDDPDPHDHPWGFISIILRNGYMDEQYKFVPTQNPPEDKADVPEWNYGQRAGFFKRECNKLGEPVRHFEPWMNESRGVRSGPFYQKVRPGTIVFRRADHIHRVIIKNGKEAWTLVFARGDRRPWGFITHTGWVYWRKYLNAWDHKHV